MVRLSGKSLFHLPAEYSPGSLVLPTCLRATGQYIVQHGTHARGIFRIPGSVRAVNALYEYYCHTDKADGAVAETVRCANLPAHIRAEIHDVASTFKKFLSVLPGGILGSTAVFDALVAIHSQLGEPEAARTKHTRLRARLIALAVGTIPSRTRRELVCAVFGLLCLVGRAAETSPREDAHGRPVPTSDLMGYEALGIVFGPLLLGDLLASYTMRVACPDGPLVVFPVSPRGKLRRRSLRESRDLVEWTGEVDKVRVANEVAEMVVTHWRDVVRHLRDLGGVRASALEGFVGRRREYLGRGRSPETPTRGGGEENGRRRARRSSFGVRGKSSIGVLSPTVEEGVVDAGEVAARLGDGEMMGVAGERRHGHGRHDSPRVSSDSVPERTSSKGVKRDGDGGSFVGSFVVRRDGGGRGVENGVSVDLGDSRSLGEERSLRDSGNPRDSAEPRDSANPPDSANPRDVHTPSRQKSLRGIVSSDGSDDTTTRHRTRDKAKSQARPTSLRKSTHRCAEPRSRHSLPAHATQEPTRNSPKVA